MNFTLHCLAFFRDRENLCSNTQSHLVYAFVCKQESFDHLQQSQTALNRVECARKIPFFVRDGNPNQHLLCIIDGIYHNLHLFRTFRFDEMGEFIFLGACERLVKNCEHNSVRVKLLCLDNCISTHNKQPLFKRHVKIRVPRTLHCTYEM